MYTALWYSHGYFHSLHSDHKANKMQKQWVNSRRHPGQWAQCHGIAYWQHCFEHVPLPFGLHFLMYRWRLWSQPVAQLWWTKLWSAPCFCFPAPSWARGRAGPESGVAHTTYTFVCGVCVHSLRHTPYSHTWLPGTLSRITGPSKSPVAHFPSSWAFSACHLPVRDGHTQQSAITLKIAHIVQLCAPHTSVYPPCLSGASQNP